MHQTYLFEFDDIFMHSQVELTLKRYIFLVLNAFSILGIYNEFLKLKNYKDYELIHNLFVVFSCRVFFLEKDRICVGID